MTFEAVLGGGPDLSQTLPPNTSVPLSLPDLRHGPDGWVAEEVTFHHFDRYVVEVWLGSDVSPATRSTVGVVVASIRPWAPPRPSSDYGRCVGGWEREHVSVSAELDGRLGGVAALSPADAWAVGTYSHFVPGQPTPSPSTAEPGRRFETGPFAAHWDGKSWTVTPTPEPAPERGFQETGSFRDVAAISPHDVWAVGGRGNYGLIEHWGGTGWTVVPSPQVNLVDTTLVAASGSGPDDAWAVGAGGTGGAIGAIVEHWDGDAWTLSPVPESIGTRYTTAEDVSAASPTDAWVVGQRWDQALALHWDGSRWSAVATPEIRSPELASVIDLGPTDAWAVGTSYADVDGNGPAHAMIDHWDGTRWRAVALPALPPQSTLAAISGSVPPTCGPSDGEGRHRARSGGWSCISTAPGGTWRRFRLARPTRASTRTLRQPPRLLGSSERSAHARCTSGTPLSSRAPAAEGALTGGGGFLIWEDLLDVHSVIQRMLNAITP